MKTIKIAIIALLAAFTFSAAKAQVSIHAHIGTRPVPHRVVVVHHPVYHHYYHRPVYHHYYRRPVYHHYQSRPVYHHSYRHH